MTGVKLAEEIKYVHDYLHITGPICAYECVYITGNKSFGNVSAVFGGEHTHTHTHTQ